MKYLSTVIPTIRNTAGLARGAVYGTHKYLGGGIAGLGKMGVMGIGAFLSVSEYGNEYGTGGALAFSALSYIPYVGQFFMAGHGVSFALGKGNEIYKNNRRLEMRKPVQDNYGTIQMMRQESIRRLSRDKAGLSRTIGNEAMRFARR